MKLPAQIAMDVDPTKMPDEMLKSGLQEFYDAAKARGMVVTILNDTVELTPVKAEPEHTLDVDEIGENLTEQFDVASEAYKNLLFTLNLNRSAADQFAEATPDELQTAFSDWLTDEKVEYVRQLMESDPGQSFTLVITPNVKVAAGELAGAAGKIADKLGQKAHTWIDLYQRYSGEQLSGTNDPAAGPVRFSLLPNKLDARFYNTAENQRAYLAEWQKFYPAHVPSPLEAVAYWMRLVTEEPGGITGRVHDRTYISHFDLPTHSLGGVEAVPASNITDEQIPSLYYAPAKGIGFGRIAVS